MTTRENLQQQLKKTSNKKGLYIICLNNTKELSDEEYNDFSMSAKELVNYILTDSNNLVAIHALSSKSIFLEKTSVCQHKNDAHKLIDSISKQKTHPGQVLSRFINYWRDPGDVSNLFEIFMVVISPSWNFNPGIDFYENSLQKKITLLSLVFGEADSLEQTMATRDQTFQFSGAKELFEEISLLSGKVDRGPQKSLDQSSSEFESIRNYVLSLNVSEVEKLMGIYSYNILLFGRIGAGKSSFASTLNRAVTGSFDPNFAFVDFTYKPCTKEINKVDLFNCSPIKVWDTFGLDDENYDNQILENILDGKTTDLFQPGNHFLSHEQRLGEFAHTVVLVADVQIFAEQDELENLRKKVNIIKQKKHFPILVLTKLDTLLTSEEKKNSILDLNQTRYGKQITKKAQEVFHIDRNSIFFVVNYIGNEPQDLYKELLCFRILEQVVERAKQFINNRKKVLVIDAATLERKVILLTREDITVGEFREIYCDQLVRLMKTGDFVFVGCKEDENKILLGEIIKINQDYGERLKSILLMPEIKKLHTRHPSFTQRTISDSLNDRASKSHFVIKNNNPSEEKRRSMFRLEKLQQTPDSNCIERYNSNGPSSIEFRQGDESKDLDFLGKTPVKKNLLTLDDLHESSL